MNIGELLNNRRNELHLTLEEVGKAVGVSKSTVMKWESGSIGNMKRDKIASLAKILRISPVSLIVGEMIYENEDKYNFYLSTHEREIIIAYRAQPSLQIAVDRTLGLSEQPDKSEKLA